MDLKGTWKVINHMRNKNNTHDYKFTVDDFNNYFSSIMNENSFVEIKHCDASNDTHNFHKIQTHNLFQFWKKIKKRHNTNPDLHGFCLKMLEYTIYAPNVNSVLVNLINESITTKVYPECFKVSVVIPLPKVDSPIEVSHYRPISSQSQLSKLFEKSI